MLLYLAPMEGVVDHHFRKLLTNVGGIDVCTTEFIRVTDSRLPARVFRRSCPELDNQSKTASDTPVKVQLLGSNPQAVAYNAAKAAKLGAIGIDLNFGCPAKTVNNSLGGATLLKTPDQVFKIVEATRAAVPKDTPVSAKIRLGYEDRSLYKDNADAIEAGGAQEITVHARSKADGYKPPAYWEYITELRERLTIPVVANGEIWTVEDYARCKQQTGCERFMVGRGLLATPDLGRQIKAYENGETCSTMNWAGVCTLLDMYFKETVGMYPEKYAGNRLKQWLSYLRLQYSEAEIFFEIIKRMSTITDLQSALDNAIARGNHAQKQKRR